LANVAELCTNCAILTYVQRHIKEVKRKIIIITLDLNFSSGTTTIDRLAQDYEDVKQLEEIKWRLELELAQSGKKHRPEQRTANEQPYGVEQQTTDEQQFADEEQAAATQIII
jgi:hypothetical protein